MLHNRFRVKSCRFCPTSELHVRLPGGRIHTFIGWTPEMLEKNRQLLAYNSRFLILPWVKVPHLASHLLAKCARSISADWQTLYHHPVFWLETFVDTELFKGTCYRAANWIFLGNISGRGKYNKTQKQLTSIKAMYGFPLVKQFRHHIPI